MQRLILTLLGLVLALGLATPVAYAAPVPLDSDAKNKGLYLSPLRSYVTLDAGKSATRALTVANLTNSPMTISTHIEQFSVTDYTYDYRFDEVDNNWVNFVENSITLDPYKSHKVQYTITPPANATPGGHYYTLYVASQADGSATGPKVQAATLLYLTIKGSLTYTYQVLARSMPKLVVTPRVGFTVDIKNTGNIYYFAHIESSVDGLLYRNAPTGSSQLLMQDKVRHIEQTIKSPVLPGVYKLSYAITPDKGDKVEGSQYFLFMPPWFIALLIIATTAAAYYTVKLVKSTIRRKSKSS